MNVALIDNALQEARSRGEIDCEKIGFREIPVSEKGADGEWHFTDRKIHQAWAVRGDRIAYSEMAPELIELGPRSRLVDVFCKVLSAELEVHNETS